MRNHGGFFYELKSISAHGLLSISFFIKILSKDIIYL